MWHDWISSPRLQQQEQQKQQQHRKQQTPLHHSRQHQLPSLLPWLVPVFPSKVHLSLALFDCCLLSFSTCLSRFSLFSFARYLPTLWLARIVSHVSEPRWCGVRGGEGSWVYLWCVVWHSMAWRCLLYRHTSTHTSLRLDSSRVSSSPRSKVCVALCSPGKCAFRPLNLLVLVRVCQCTRADSLLRRHTPPPPLPEPLPTSFSLPTYLPACRPGPTHMCMCTLVFSVRSEPAENARLLLYHYLSRPRRRS